MNLHDQLKQVTKTKEEVYAKEYREGYILKSSIPKMF